jgi:putative SOS response-associated peptidase YedK
MERAADGGAFGAQYWAKDAKIGLLTINARAETVTTNAAFREAMKRRRCLVPAAVFYEWQKIDTKTKQPYAIGLKDGALFAFAGLWEQWRHKATGQPLETYTIITTDPNELMEPIHSRMPAIVPVKDYERWLAVGDPAQLPIDLLRSFPSEEMTAWKVDGRVGNVRNDDERLVAPAGI